jgi:hypothetical protein
MQPPWRSRSIRCKTNARGAPGLVNSLRQVWGLDSGETVPPATGANAVATSSASKSPGYRRPLGRIIVHVVTSAARAPTASLRDGCATLAPAITTSKAARRGDGEDQSYEYDRLNTFWSLNPSRQPITTTENQCLVPLNKDGPVIIGLRSPSS